MELSTQIQTAESFNGFMTTNGSGTLTSGSWGYMTTGYCQPLSCNHWYTNYGENRTEKAYAVIRALMKAKVVKITTLNQFFEAMDEVVKVL